jgi:pyridoxine/pyridoxamine 5'-phosphate oxidase
VQKDKAAAEYEKKHAPKNAKPKKEVTTDKAGNRLSLLNNWMELADALKEMPEKEAEALITAERKGQCRPNILLRLHGRFNKMRGMREKTEIMQKIG